MAALKKKLTSQNPRTPHRPKPQKQSALRCPRIHTHNSVPTRFHTLWLVQIFIGKTTQLWSDSVARIELLNKPLLATRQKLWQQHNTRSYNFILNYFEDAAKHANEHRYSYRHKSFVTRSKRLLWWRHKQGAVLAGFIRSGTRPEWKKNQSRNDKFVFRPPVQAVYIHSVSHRTWINSCPTKSRLFWIHVKAQALALFTETRRNLKKRK